jgi:hypothetical protein
MRRLLILLTLLLAPPAAAQQPEPEWRQAREEQVLVRLNAFEPEVLRLRAGVPTRLVFYNASRTIMGLSAPGLFARSHVRSGDREAVSGGGLRIAPGESRAILIVPVEGRYRIRSRSWLRRFVGMSALVIVEAASAR